MGSTTMTAEQIVERNLQVVAAHFHNENPADIDNAINLYSDRVTWELPARGELLTTHAAVKDAYLKMFRSLKPHAMTFIRRVAAQNWVFDDGALDATLVGDVATNIPNCPFPSGTRINMRIVHFFELDDDGRITRENGYELWRRADATINDDIPPDAVVVRFD